MNLTGNQVCEYMALPGLSIETEYDSPELTIQRITDGVRFEVPTTRVMKSPVFWGITLCSPLKCEPTLRRNISPPFPESKNRPAGGGQAPLATCFHAGFL
jgi:hypothetical protein